MSMENLRDDEIDLAQLLYKVWEGKWIVVTWVVILTSIMLGYALLRTPLYKIEAVINRSQSSSLIPIQPTTLNNGDVNAVSKLDEKTIYNSTLLQLDSLNVLREFWAEYEENKRDEDDKFRSFVKSLNVESVNPKGEEPQSRRVEISSIDIEQGITLLNGYLAFLNKRIQSQYVAEVHTNLKASLASIDRGIRLLEANGQKNLSYDLVKLKESYDIAKSLKITSTPYKDLENIGLTVLDGRDYLLGTDALSLQIDTLSAREGKSLRAYDQKINNLFLARTIVASDIARLSEFDDVVAMFKIEKRAESSIDPIGARNVFLLIGGLIAGLFIGCLHVFLLNLLRANSR